MCVESNFIRPLFISSSANCIEVISLKNFQMKPETFLSLCVLHGFGIGNMTANKVWRSKSETCYVSQAGRPTTAQSNKSQSVTQSLNFSIFDQPAWLFVYASVCLSVCPSVCPFIHPFMISNKACRGMVRYGQVDWWWLVNSQFNGSHCWKCFCFCFSSSNQFKWNECFLLFWVK